MKQFLRRPKIPLFPDTFEAFEKNVRKNKYERKNQYFCRILLNEIEFARDRHFFDIMISYCQFFEKREGFYVNSRA